MYFRCACSTCKDSSCRTESRAFSFDLFLAFLPGLRLQQLLADGGGGLHGLEELVQHGVQTVRCILSRGFGSLAFRGQHLHFFVSSIIRISSFAGLCGQSTTSVVRPPPCRRLSALPPSTSASMSLPEGQLVQLVRWAASCSFCLARMKSCFSRYLWLPYSASSSRSSPCRHTKQHFPAGCIEGDLAVVAAAEGLSGSGSSEASVLMPFSCWEQPRRTCSHSRNTWRLVDVGRAFIQMQRPVQHMNMVAISVLNASMNSVTMFSVSSAEACSSSVPSW